MRTYTETHPWITFSLDLRRASYRFWLLLGEAQSKSKHVAGVPLLPGIANHLYEVYLAKGALATTAIEGNTLTEDEVQKLIEGKLDLPPSKEYLGQEVDNIIEACNMIASRILSGRSVEMCVDDIKEYNALVLKNLPLGNEVIPGQIRGYSVGIARYKGAPHEDCEHLLDRLCEWLNREFQAPEGYETAFGILKAIIAHVHLAWIHPFGDGNGRTARLLEFQILLSVGVPATAAHLLSNHYNQTRSEYYRQLDLTHRSGGDVFPFIEYALQGFIDQLKGQIEVIKQQQLYVHWINYIHDRFRNRDRDTDIRRRRLVIDLSNKTSPTPLSEIRHVSPRIAEAYANRTDKTVVRDINALQEMDLVEKTPQGIKAKRETMLAFLPPTRQPEEQPTED